MVLDVVSDVVSDTVDDAVVVDLDGCRCSSGVLCVGLCGALCCGCSRIFLRSARPALGLGLSQLVLLLTRLVLLDLRFSGVSSVSVSSPSSGSGSGSGDLRVLPPFGLEGVTSGVEPLLFLAARFLAWVSAAFLPAAFLNSCSLLSFSVFYLLSFVKHVAVGGTALARRAARTHCVDWFDK